MDDDEDTISEACMKVKSGHQVITQLHAIKYTEKDPQRACVCVDAITGGYGYGPHAHYGYG